MVKLAFWKTVADAYRFVFTDPIAVIRAGWVFFSVYLIFLFQKSMYVGPVPLYVGVTVAVAYYAAYASWQIALSRTILANENSWIAGINLGRRFWRLVGAIALSVLILTGIVGIPIIVVGVAATALGFEPHSLGKALVVVVGVIFALVLPRLYLFSPAIATDDHKKAIRAAWRRGKHNTLRLAFGSVICWLPSWITLAVVYETLGQIPGVAAAQLSVIAAVLYLVWAIFNFFTAAVWVVFQALAYRQLAPNWTPPPALMAAQIET